MINTIYEKGDISPRISNSVISTLLDTDLIQCTPHRIFAYCYIGVISYLKFNRKYEQYDISVKEIKGMMNKSKRNQDFDYLIKKGGILYLLGLVEDVRNPFSTGVRNRVKFPLALDEMTDCHTFNIKLFIECTAKKNIGLTGFFIANYLKEFDKNYVYGIRGSVNSMSRILKIPISTVSGYLEELAKYNIIKSNNIKNIDTLSEINTYARSKLTKWRNDSLEYNGKKCFVTGRCDNIIVHHVIPFNQMRDYVLNNLNIVDKTASEITKDEFNLIENKILEYHQLSVGVPLHENVHNKFHRMYGNNSTLEDLLEFKNNYSS